MKVTINAAQAMTLVMDVATSTQPTTTDEGDLGDRIVPRDLRQFLARLRLLGGVPFSYLVPASRFPRQIQVLDRDGNPL